MRRLSACIRRPLWSVTTTIPTWSPQTTLGHQTTTTPMPTHPTTRSLLDSDQAVPYGLTLAPGAYSPELGSRSPSSRFTHSATGASIEPCADDQVTIRHGRNAWLLVRTDRDAPTPEDAVQTAGAFLNKVLQPASPPADRNPLQVLQSPLENGGPFAGRFVIGAARPVVVRAFQVRDVLSPPQPAGATERHTDCARPLAVRAKKPWFVLVGFDWRAPDVRVSWPKRAVNFIGIPRDTDLENDWLLLTAAYQGDQMVPDTSLLDEFVIALVAKGKRVVAEIDDAVEQSKAKLQQGIKAVQAPLLVGLALGAVVGAAYLVYRFRKDRS